MDILQLVSKKAMYLIKKESNQTLIIGSYKLKPNKVDMHHCYRYDLEISKSGEVVVYVMDAKIHIWTTSMIEDRLKYYEGIDKE